jgi:hypothetical protein
VTSASGRDIDAREIRLQMARTIAPAFAAAPAVVAVCVGGSVARGWADRWSDVEVGVVWSETPAAEQRRHALRDVPIVRHRVFPDPSAVGALEEELVSGGIKVDVAHMTVAALESVISDVTEVADPDPAKQALLASLLVAIPLHGLESIEAWRQRAQRFPYELSRAIVAKHLAFGPHDYLTMLAEREDLLLLSDVLCRVVRNVLGILCGLNRVYVPSADLKWALRLASGLSIAPPDLPSRLRHILRGDPTVAVADVQHLIDETISLVESHLPDIDITPIRARISQARSV